MKTKNIIIPVAALLIGYFVGALFGFPLTTDGASSGNIAKVSRYHSNVVSPATSAFMEKLRNDTTELNKTVVSLTLLSSRMEEFSNLVEIAIDAAEGKEALADNLKTLKTVRDLADNANKAGSVAMSSFDNAFYGAKHSDAIEYEQASQNLTLAYLMVDRQLKVGKDFVAAVDDYLRSNADENNTNLAFARDLWMNYCAGNAVLNGDEDELSYWASKNSALTAAEFLGHGEFSKVEGQYIKNIEAGVIPVSSEMVKAWEILPTKDLVKNYPISEQFENQIKQFFPGKTEIIKGINTDQNQVIKGINTDQNQVIKGINTDQNQVIKGISIDQNQVIKGISIDQNQVIKGINIDQNQLLKGLGVETQNLINNIIPTSPVVIK